MSELFESFPHESGIVMQRGIEIGIVFSSFLISHCLYILSIADRSLSPYPIMDIGLEIALFARVILSIPRPYVWLSTWRKFVRARRQPTPELVAEALSGIYNNQNGLEKFLLYFYYGWLALVSVVVLVIPYRTPFSWMVWRHMLYNFGCIVLHRIVCIVMFYHLVNSDMPRGLHQSVIEDESTIVNYDIITTPTTSSECPICYCDYLEQEKIRVLKCGHSYHKDCVDLWLTQHRNRCPMCMLVVGTSITSSSNSRC